MLWNNQVNSHKGNEMIATSKDSDFPDPKVQHHNDVKMMFESQANWNFFSTEEFHKESAMINGSSDIQWAVSICYEPKWWSWVIPELLW